MTVGEVTQDRFGGFIRSDWIGRLMVAEAASTAQDIQRTRREISRTDAEYLQIGMVYRGVGRVVQDGREAILRPGDYAIHEATRPFRWTFGADWDVGVFTLPRGSVGLSESESRLLTARRLDGQTGITGVVSRFLRDLGRSADSLSGRQSERVLADVTDLVLTLLSDWADDSDAVRSSVQRSLIFRMRRTDGTESIGRLHRSSRAQRAWLPGAPGAASFPRGEEAFGGGRLHDVARLEVRRSVSVAADASTTQATNEEAECNSDTQARPRPAREAEPQLTGRTLHKPSRAVVLGCLCAARGR